jgi:FAD/FMN-containing dehydrogenase
VVDALGCARRHGVPIAVRGGGHNGPGLGSVEAGLVIDLRMMRDIVVDADQRRVRVGAGCTSGDVDRATAPHGLAVPFGIVSTTGVGGLTLGGGVGYLSRAYGLTIDNLLEAEVVLADGRVVTASPTSHPDLFWALRGGGGNFGVVLSFLFQGHPVSEVFGGPVFFDIEHGREVMSAYREFLDGAPEDLGVFVGLKTVPAVDPFPAEFQGRQACALVSCYNGTEAAGRAAMAALLGALPEPWFDWRSVMPFTGIQSMFDPLLPSGLQWYWRGDFVRELPDEAIDAHLAQARRLPYAARSLMHLYPIDGAVHRVASDATAWRARDSRWAMVIAGIDPDPARAESVTRWTKDYWAAVHPWSADGGYVNFMMEDGDTARLQATYGDNYARLVEVKTIYDPDNVFASTQNIKPAATKPAERKLPA